jgi:hypothetical protein
VHPHTLRHSCGYYLADKGTDLRTILGIATRVTRYTTHALLEGGLRGCGSEKDQFLTLVLLVPQKAGGIRRAPCDAQ